MKINEENQGIAMKCYKLEKFFYIHKMEMLAKLIFRFMQIFLGCTIPYTADIGPNCVIPHFHGVVIVYRAQIGDNTRIYQNVTVGGKNGKCPIIGKNCILGAGSVILGGNCWRQCENRC